MRSKEVKVKRREEKEEHWEWKRGEVEDLKGINER